MSEVELLDGAAANDLDNDDNNARADYDAQCRGAGVRDDTSGVAVGRTTWLLVRLPGRLLAGPPNGRTGWIKASGTRIGVFRWHIVISLSQRTARIYHNGRKVRQWLVVVGKPSTPTPSGNFFVEENIA